MDKRQSCEDNVETMPAQDLALPHLPEMDPVTLLARANTYFSLAHALAYPSDQFLDSLQSGRFLQEVRQAIAVIEPQVALTAALDRLASALDELRGSPVQLREEHTYLFARQVQASPYGTSYGHGLAFGQMRDREDLAGYYAAFGFQVATRNAELHDHVGVEMEFVGALSAKEAYAADTGQTESAAICRQARASLVGKHLIDWLPKFVARLEAAARLDFYPSIGFLALALIQGEPIITQPEVPSFYCGDPDGDEDEFSCGAIGEHCLGVME